MHQFGSVFLWITFGALGSIRIIDVIMLGSTSSCGLRARQPPSCVYYMFQQRTANISNVLCFRHTNLARLFVRGRISAVVLLFYCLCTFIQIRHIPVSLYDCICRFYFRQIPFFSASVCRMGLLSKGCFSLVALTFAPLRMELFSCALYSALCFQHLPLFHVAARCLWCARVARSLTFRYFAHFICFLFDLITLGSRFCSFCTARVVYMAHKHSSARLSQTKP